MGAEVGDSSDRCTKRMASCSISARRQRALDERHGHADERNESSTPTFVVIGVGVRPAISLAEQAGLASTAASSVDEYLETSVPGIFAAGDIARWPDPHTGETIRVEHWVVAERQGQTAARNILGQRERFDAVPFFWSQHYDVTISYVGHAEKWDRIEIDGDVDARDCTVTYYRGDRKQAVLTISRDLESLRAELAFERNSAL